jgi:glc operon protein GlcG
LRHRIVCLALLGRLALLAAAIGLSVVAYAQNVPAQFVVTGKAAEKLQDYSTLNLATAQRIAETCERLVTAHGGGQHSIIFLDKEGNHIYYDRMDGQGYTNVVTPEMKALTALRTRAPSVLIQNIVAQNPEMEAYEVQLGRYPVEGGIPIVIDHQMIGVVGTGGYPPNPPEWEDGICAQKAMLEVLGPSIPPLPEDVRQQRPANRGTLPMPSFGTRTPPKSSLSPDFVVTGAGAAHVFDANQISLAAAKKLVRACRDWAASKGGTMSAYVLDNAGEMVHMERMDGQISNDVHTALLKAQTALKLREPTSIRGTQMLNAGRPSPRNLGPNMFNFYLDSGGIPIVVDGQMVGAVGVSGVDGGQDENCAIEGLKAAFGDHALLPVYGAAGAARAPAAGTQH